MQALVKELVELRKQIAEYDEAYEQATTPLKAKRDEIQAQITEELKKMGVLSQRFQEATVSRAVRKTVQVVDEAKAVASFKRKGLNDYFAERLTPLFYDSVAREIAKAGKTDIDGLAIQEKEYLSVRGSEKEERRKVSVE